jgi:hypothetical protein
LLVETAKRFCHRNVAHCEECPLGKFLVRNSKFETRNSERRSGFESRIAVSTSG